jgi:hypothetical protein
MLIWCFSRSEIYQHQIIDNLTCTRGYFADYFVRKIYIISKYK